MKEQDEELSTREKKPNILYVDDEQENLTVFKYTFRKHYKIFLANSADEGMQILQENDIQLIISDQRMPGITGVEFLENTAVKYPDIVRMILTGFSDVEAIVQAINKGRVYRYLTKPWEKEEFKVTIDNAIEAFNFKLKNKQLLVDLQEANETLEKKVVERTAEVVRQKEMIEAQNENIKGSIRYAKTIQHAMLPMDVQMRESFEYFIVYRAKDIVSGDFYWFAKIQHEGKTKRIAAVLDCTGHGVPGAFMTIMASALLEKIVNQQNIVNPLDILENLDKGVMERLQQEHTSNNDGMDACICLIDDTKIVFAGAKRPLFYYSKQSNEVNSIKGSRRSIGGARVSRQGEPFEDHEFEYQKGDVIYLSSDGYADQNGGPDRRKLGSLLFLQTLTQAALLPVEEQKTLLENVLDKHMQGSEQRDDITVWGIRL